MTTRDSACTVLKIGESYQNYLNVFILSSCHLKVHIIAKVVFLVRSGILFPLFYRIILARREHVIIMTTVFQRQLKALSVAKAVLRKCQFKH